MGYEGCMGFLHTYPAYHVGNEKNLWDLRGYGLSGVQLYYTNSIMLIYSTSQKVKTKTQWPM